MMTASGLWSVPGACHIPSLSKPAAAGPPGASSLSARSAAMRCGGRCGCDEWREGKGQWIAIVDTI